MFSSFPWPNDVLDFLDQIISIHLPGLGVGGCELHPNHVKMVGDDDISDWNILLTQGTFPSAKR